MIKKISLHNIAFRAVIMCGVLSCVFAISVVAQEGEAESLENIYSEAQSVRNQAIDLGVEQYDAILFENAEASYEEGAFLYEGNDARAVPLLSTAVQEYKRLIELAESGKLRELAIQEYQRAEDALKRVALDISMRNDELLKEGVLTDERQSDTHEAKDMMDKEMMDEDMEMMDKDMMDKEMMDEEMMDDKDAESEEKDDVLQ